MNVEKLMALGLAVTVGAGLAFLGMVTFGHQDCRSFRTELAALTATAQDQTVTATVRRSAQLTSYYLLTEDRTGCASASQKAVAHAYLDQSR